MLLICVVHIERWLERALVDSIEQHGKCSEREIKAFLKKINVLRPKDITCLLWSLILCGMFDAEFLFVCWSLVLFLVTDFGPIRICVR